MRKIICLISIFVSLFFFGKTSYSQIGGDNTFEFLNMPLSPRIASLGGNFLSINDDDIALALSNPSLINKGIHNNLGLCFVDHFSDISSGYAIYSRTYEKYGSFTGAIQFIDYGSFTETDAAGNKYGEFGASEYAFIIGWGRQLTPLFSIGANLKYIYSSMYDYYANGIAVDLAGNYYNKDKNLSISLIAANAGRQLKAYNTGNVESLPFELKFGISKKLEHVPFRFSLLYTHIEKWDLTYVDPRDEQDGFNTIDSENNNNDKSDLEEFSDKLMRHIVIGGEFLPSKNLSIRLGYNYQRRQEMKVDTKVATVGFSWGVSLKISKFRISYARSAYHLSGSPNYISITTNLSDFISKES